ncbi:m-phase inducer phosphatase [Saxophila tyrrhenica]|uniref:M-phase inducer phosphatase n=1 Tax=Saxophila tyrrhenica TaxID=1690608 RepID=A0AAV9PAP5_9PEZI|nr:m-phase inducer phosphatase [Saxophila tyrrhenica]
MEYSSPLAAMRPQPHVGWGHGKDLPIPRSSYHGFQTYGPNSFNFKDLSMQQRPAKQDYFTLKPVRGSSPTSSLTADLDANFHIDKSPQAPTPRRSLFTADLFKPRDDAGRLMTPPIEVDEVTTPDIPSSSPCLDAMDISPLPHKAPHFVAQVSLPSPTPEPTPGLDALISPDLLSPNDQPIPQAFPQAFPSVPEPLSFTQISERRRPATRPSLSKQKAYSSNYVPQQISTTETQLPPFRFGNVANNGLSCSSTPSLLGSFTESPVDDLRSDSAQKMPPPPPRRPSLSSVVRSNGSPSTGHVRKPSGGRQAPVRPPRKSIRRSLSMFQHPDEVMKEEQDMFEPQACLASAMDVDQEQKQHQPKLPCFVPDDEPDSLPRISQSTMVDVLNAKYSSEYERIVVVDCRFEYEYNGGHIENAVNFNDKQQLAHELFSSPSPASTLLILHCEYSVHRAPLTAKFIRAHDRSVNFENYPNLTYPDMYILDGGYSKFFAEHRSKCFPQNYVEMNDHRHEQACERGMAKVKQRQKLFRHQTFAFGTSPHDEMDDSPTAPQGRTMGSRSRSTFNVGDNIASGIGESFARRMASY